MKRAVFLLVILVLADWTFAQSKMSSKDIFQAHRGAVVQVYVNDSFRGTGFISSADGYVVTANHVVSTRESKYRTLASDIKILVAGRDAPYPAIPVNQDSDKRVNYDSVVLKIQASGLPYLVLGDWNETDIADPISVIPNFPGMGAMLLIGTVSNKARATTNLGPQPINTILFQAPIRSGFSGSPTFSSSGRVIGIVTTKVFGISMDLDTLRQQIAQAASTGSSVQIMGIDPLAAQMQIINGLDQGLISGLGSGVAISYAREVQQSQTKANRQ